MGKNEDAILWRVRSKVFLGNFGSCEALQGVLVIKTSSGRCPRAYPLRSPPPGRAAQCCEAFKAEVSFCRYPFWLFSCQGAANVPAYQKPDAGTEGCSPNPWPPSSWTAALAPLNIHCRMHPALDRWYCCEASYLTPWIISYVFALDPAKSWQVFGLFLSFFNNEK